MSTPEHAQINTHPTQSVTTTHAQRSSKAHTDSTMPPPAPPKAHPRIDN